MLTPTAGCRSGTHPSNLASEAADIKPRVISRLQVFLQDTLPNQFSLGFQSGVHRFHFVACKNL